MFLVIKSSWFLVVFVGFHCDFASEQFQIEISKKKFCDNNSEKQKKKTTTSFFRKKKYFDIDNVLFINTMHCTAMCSIGWSIIDQIFSGK